MTPPENKPRRGERGFTLLELMVVIAILGMLATVAVTAVYQTKGKADVQGAKLAIKGFEENLDMYNLDNGGYPPADVGLQALITKPADAPNWAGPYIKTKSVPLDPWKRPYVYHYPSNRADHEYDLCSNGPKGQPGGAGSDGPICNE
jgi:general secretion pathway protein G